MDSASFAAVASPRAAAKILRLVVGSRARGGRHPPRDARRHFRRQFLAAAAIAPRRRADSSAAPDKDEAVLQSAPPPTPSGPVGAMLERMWDDALVGGLKLEAEARADTARGPKPRRSTKSRVSRLKSARHQT